MSFESAKKMGFTASIIQLTVPVIAIAVLVAFYISLFSSILSTVGGASTSSASVWFTTLLPFIIIPIVAVGLAGYILFLIAMYRLSLHFNEKAIFKNLLNALIIQIISSVVVTVVVFLVLLTSFGSLAPTATLNGTTFFWSFLGLFAVVILAMYIVSIYCGLLYKRSFDKLAEKSGVEGFRTAGLLYFIGSILGNLIVWIAWIFVAQSFNKLTPTQQVTQQSPYTTYQPYQPSPAAQTTPTKRCPTCGADNSPDSLYCAKCGHQL
jgi:uncharacterized membrane protein